MTPTAEIIEVSNTLVAQQPGWPQDKIDLVKATVAKDASDDELQMFLALAAKYELDPFAKEIYFIKDSKGKVRTEAGRDGYLAIANRHPAFEGLTSDVIYTGDEYQRTATGVDHRYNIAERKMPIVGAYALVYRSDRNVPAYFFARFGEYAPTNPESWSTWKKFPAAMILARAEKAALRSAFSISGFVMDDDPAPESDEPRPSFENRPRLGVGASIAPKIVEPEQTGDDEGADPVADDIADSFGEQQTLDAADKPE